MRRSLAAVLGTTLALGCVGATPAYAGGGTWKTLKRVLRRPFTRTQIITPGADRAGFLHPLGDTPGIAVFGKNDATDKRVQQSSYLLGRQIAAEGFALASGGGKGLPKLAEDGAFFHGGQTIAFTPQGTFESHARSHDGDTRQTTHLVLVGTGGGTGAIAREAPMAESVRAGIYVNGGSGTFGELMALLHNPRGVVGLLKGSGGVADFAERGILPYVGLPAGRFTVRANADAKTLVQEVAAAYHGLPAEESASGPRRLINPGKPQRILSSEEREGRVVASLFADDERATAGDRDAAAQLSKLWMKESESLAKKGGTIVMPNGVTGARVAEESGRVVLVDGGAPAKDAAKDAMKRSTRYLGLGDSRLVPFITAREASQDADVVFLTSAHYTNLSALAYALRDDRKPIIAVLRSRSTHGDKIGAMVEAIDAKAYQKRYVEADTPEALMKLVRKAMAARGEVTSTSDGKTVD